jgi:uncharacterized protein YegP (UPF0339 family)
MGFETYPRPVRLFGWRLRNADGKVITTSQEAWTDREQAKLAVVAVVLATRETTYGQRDADAIAAAVTDVDE